VSDPQAAALLAQIREYEDYRTSATYYIGQAVCGLLDLGLTRKEVIQQVQEELQVKLDSPRITNYLAYRSLPDCPATRKLTLSRVYALRDKQPLGWEQKALDAADPTTAYTWAAFDADVLGKLPPEEKPWRPCPVDSRPCGRIAKEDS
jgi:hypothetical protein